MITEIISETTTANGERIRHIEKHNVVTTSKPYRFRFSAFVDGSWWRCSNFGDDFSKIHSPNATGMNCPRSVVDVSWYELDELFRKQEPSK